MGSDSTSPQGRIPSRNPIVDARLETVEAFRDWRDTTPRIPWRAACREFVQRYNAGEIRVSEETRELVPSISDKSLRRWHALVREGFDWRELAPRRRGPPPRIVLDPDPRVATLIESHVRCFYPSHEAGHIRDDVRAVFGPRNTPALRTLQHRIARWVRENKRDLDANSNPDRHRSKTMPAFGDASANVKFFNQRVEFDTSPVDMLCTDGIFTIVSGIDAFSRLPENHVAQTPSGAAFGALLRRWILEHGIMDIAVTDGGKDFVGHYPKRLFRQIRIEHKQLPPYCPWMKSHASYCAPCGTCGVGFP